MTVCYIYILLLSVCLLIRFFMAYCYDQRHILIDRRPGTADCQPTKKAPFICTLWAPIHFSFNSQQGPPLPILFGYDIFLLISILIILFKNPNHNSLFSRCYISLTWFRRGHYPSLETILLTNGFPGNTCTQCTVNTLSVGNWVSDISRKRRLENKNLT